MDPNGYQFGSIWMSIWVCGQDILLGASAAFWEQGLLVRMSFLSRVLIPPASAGPDRGRSTSRTRPASAAPGPQQRRTR